jgi:cytochrome o ubiquinol oxidase subunit 1
MCGLGFQVLQVIVSVHERKKNRDTNGDPWNGRTLEWSTTSPPPFYNFAFIPEVHERDAFWHRKHSKTEEPAHRKYEEIHMPKNTSMGFYIGIFSFLFGFGLIWYMFWLAILSTIGIVACVILHLYQKHPDYHVSVEEVKKIESRHHA